MQEFLDSNMIGDCERCKIVVSFHSSNPPLEAVLKTGAFYASRNQQTRPGSRADIDNF